MPYRRGWTRDFDRAVRENPDWPVAVSEGDSWFSYALQKNVIDHLDDPTDAGNDKKQRAWSLLRLEKSGDEVLSVMSGGSRAYLRELLDRYAVDALLFSAGGNDLIGADLLPVLKPFVAGAPAEACFVDQRLDRRLRQIEDSYRELLDLVKDDGADLKVYVNSYDYPVPSEKSAKLLGSKVAGPWLRPAFKERGYPANHALERDIPHLLIDRFCALLDCVSADYPARLVRVETRGAVGKEWSDEIHPNRKGAKAVAERFADALRVKGVLA